ncbi:hypothetical protein HPB48_012316 [Haemaphysalis longicornis]|uniref:G-protein coupled receptors family 1 profile domain-containing protein n=1 Tax=Haemaphysalis longicornis TaxID=44386 RepID=A0A9J6GVZ5_HAELO|nr:hypothetical protein HPB48_012316 [Haemaphysalis longicornis]
MSAKRGPGGSEAEENTTAVSGGVLSQAAQISVTRMLLVVSTAFVLLNLPSYVMRIYVFVLSFRDSEEATGSLPYILQRYFMLLYYTSFATNFILYNASSQIFRIALKGYVRSKCEFLGGAFARFSFRSRSTSSSCRKGDNGLGGSHVVPLRMNTAAHTTFQCSVHRSAEKAFIPRIRYGSELFCCSSVLRIDCEKSKE